jgi:hypothetical protein
VVQPYSNEDNFGLTAHDKDIFDIHRERYYTLIRNTDENDESNI